ncbi:MAG: Tfp pilus assembly protein PilF [Bermanella sp.]
MLNDHASALELMQPAYIANPTDSLVANNFAVSLIFSGQLLEASKIISTAIGNAKNTEYLSLLATSGLLLFRYGEPDNGREFYSKARESLREDSSKRNEFICCLYWAWEEALSGNSDKEDLRRGFHTGHSSSFFENSTTVS